MKNIFALFFLLLFFPSYSLSSEVVRSGQYFVGVPNEPNNINMGIWDGTNQIQSNEGYCAVSYFRIFIGFTQGIDFTFSSPNGYTADNRFILINSKDNSQLPVTIETLNPDTGNYTTAIPENRFNSGTGLNDCAGEGQNPFSIRVTANPADLANASDGTYTGQINFSSFVEGRNRPESFDSFSISVQVPYIVKVSQLNDINLGTFSLNGDISAEEQFCIFRNKNYSFNIRFNDGEGGGEYLLRGQNLNDTLKYNVSFRSDNTSYILTTKNSPISYTPLNSTINCSNSENYYIKVETKENDMISSLADNYQSTLNVIVSPE